jgi:putative phage-type endonuclease
VKTHNLIQGSPEWHAYRAQHFNASDAPAMMGCSPYKTRAQLLRELATGVTAEVDAHQQRRFDDGHRFEALCRPRAEAIIGEDLYPVTGSMGRLSASFDGLTLGEDLAFEHKSLNDDLRGVLTDADAGPRLPLHYRVQMEQQLMVSGAERVLFMASRWEGDKLVEARHCWYHPDRELRQQIVSGWLQFERDLAAYAPAPQVEKAVADPLESLPAVSVRLDGALSVAGNLPTFAVALRAFIDRMPKQPATDTEFATCDAACKALKKAEDALDAAEAGALASITDVEAMRRAVADCRKLARDTRLAAEKMVERRKVEIKEQAVMRARAALDQHVGQLNAEIAPMALRPVPADFAGAIKGKRSLESMQDALDTTLAEAKIAADGQARAIRVNLAAFQQQASGFEFLFADLAALVHKPADDFARLLASRVSEHKAAEELREKQRAEAEAARIAAAEQRARDDEARRIAAAQAEAAAAVAHAAAPAPIAVQACRPADRQMLATPAGAELLQKASAAIRADEPATLNLGAIGMRLGFALTAAFVTDTLRIEPAEVVRGVRLYRESDFPRICAALIAHVSALELAAA